MRKDINNKNENLKAAMNEVGEDATEYGEFVTTYFAWVTPDKQKEKVKEMEKMTKKKD